MWNYRYLLRIDWRLVPVVLALMGISLLIISSGGDGFGYEIDEGFFTPMAVRQLRGFGIGIGAFCFFAAFDYNKLREWAWPLYFLMLLALFGLFFTQSIVGVRRWYRLPFIHMSVQPSEYAQLALVVALSWFLERCHSRSREWSTLLGALLIVLPPFFLILKQPDLGTALVLLSIAFGLFYFGELHPLFLRGAAIFSTLLFLLIATLFLGILPQEKVLPIAEKFLKEYQLKRLDPDTHHQRAAATAIAVGGLMGKGWRRGELASLGWLPAPYTDSVFPAFGEQFGLIGQLLLIGLFYALIYFCFQVMMVASTPFGRLLAAGIATYIAAHVLINIGMMCGFLPITGVPLLLITYGGSSVIAAMSALGILQSIYSRRFMF